MRSLRRSVSCRSSPSGHSDSRGHRCIVRTRNARRLRRQYRCKSKDMPLYFTRGERPIFSPPGLSLPIQFREQRKAGFFACHAGLARRRYRGCLQVVTRSMTTGSLVRLERPFPREARKATGGPGLQPAPDSTAPSVTRRQIKSDCCPGSGARVPAHRADWQGHSKIPAQGPQDRRFARADISGLASAR
jgi:hypothetical protein